MLWKRLKAKQASAARSKLKFKIAEDMGKVAPPLVRTPVKELWAFHALGKDNSTVQKMTDLSISFKSF